MRGLAIERESEVFGWLSAQTSFALAIVGACKKEEKPRDEGENQASI